MTIKNGIKIFFTLFYLLLTIILIFLFIREMNETYKDYANNFINEVFDNIINGKIDQKTLQLLSNKYPQNLFYVVWIKIDDSNWKPLFYNKKYINESILHSYKIPSNYRYICRKFPENNPAIRTPINNILNTKTYKFYLWIYKYNLNIFIEYVFLPILCSLLVYLLFFLIIELLFSEKKRSTKQINGINAYDNDLKNLVDLEKTDDISENSKKNIIKNNDNLLESYKKLWRKNYKISEKFKIDFPFKEIYNLINYTISPEKYLYSSLDIANRYFNFKNLKVFIRQKNKYIECISKEILDENKINIPIDSNQKGKIFIPLYPYEVNNIFGFLYFEWQNDENFIISDILFFLKFLFSEKSKHIFLNHTEIKKIQKILFTRLKNQNENEVSFAIFEVDKKEELFQKLNKTENKDLNSNIKQKLISYFNKEIIFQLSTYVYGVISINQNKNEYLLKIEKWIKDKDVQLYSISPDFGDIALTFSCGIAFKNKRNLHPSVLINESELNLKKAISTGGNQVI